MRLYATSCLHLGATSDTKTLERFKEELRELPDGPKGFLLLGDIADPTPLGMLQLQSLYETLAPWLDSTLFVPGNNDWWMGRVKELPRLWMQCALGHRAAPVLPSWVHTFEGGNYNDLPWSLHHDVISYEEECQHAMLLGIDCPKTATVMASHFPFVGCAQNGNGFNVFAKSCWGAALHKTNIKTLVFGHLHKEYFQNMPSMWEDIKIQVVSDHREQLLHEVKSD